MADPDSGPGNQTWDRLWERHAASAEANPAQAFRRRLIRRLAEAAGAGPGARILDVGFGTGVLLALLAERFEGAAFAGIDLSGRAIEHAQKKMPGALLLQGDLAASAPPRELAGWATHAVCSEVLEHVDDEAGLLANVAACMRPGARLIVTVPGGPCRPSTATSAIAATTPGTGSGTSWKGPDSGSSLRSPPVSPPSTSTAWWC